MNFIEIIAQRLAERIPELDVQEIQSWIEIPPNSEMGDFAFPCFRLAKTLRKAPVMIAQELSAQLEDASVFDSVVPTGAYINFFVNKRIWAQSNVERILEEGDNFGRSKAGHGKKVIVEYSSPNIAKPFHIGHIRTTVIGHSLALLCDFMGYETVTLNHLGDYGTQFGLLIVAYRMWGEEEVIANDPINELLKLYVRINQLAKEDESVAQQARDWFKKLEEGDGEAVALWQWMRDLSLAEFEKVYRMLGIRFDSYDGESFYSDKMGRVIEILKEKQLLVESKGAMIVDLEPYGLTPAPIMKSDGSTLYITRDLAAAIYRKERYQFDKNIYVVGAQQKLHFQQMKKILELAGYEWYDDCVHVEFGTVSLEDGSLSTRQGRVVFLEDVFRKAITKTKEIMVQKNPDLPDMDEVAMDVGIGAIIFQELSTNRIKDYSFSWDRSLSFEGETGPYVQYTHARCCSVIKKSGMKPGEAVDFAVLADSPQAIEVIRLFDQFDEVLLRALDKMEPNHIARYALDLAQAFNHFYHENKIITEDAERTKAFVALTEACRQALKNALYLLGMRAPQQM